MKNAHIKVGDVVPAEIRIQCYEECIMVIESRQNPIMMSEPFTCLLLPCILWGLDSLMQASPTNEEWEADDTIKMFPEWTNLVVNQIVKTFAEKDKTRIKLLKKAIKQVKQTL